MKGTYIENMNFFGEKYNFTLGYETVDKYGEEGFFIKGVWFVKKDASLMEYWESQNVVNTLSKTFLISIEEEFKRKTEDELVRLKN